MPVPTTITDLSATASSNSPAGSESVFPNLDNYLRAAFAFIRQNYDDIQQANTDIAAVVPAGVITMWSGSSASIPAGWTLCNGSNGTPDLRSRFVVGATGTWAVGATGGESSTTSDSQGAHTHTGDTGSHVLTTSEIPSHTHTFTVNALNSDSQGQGALTGGSSNTGGSPDGTFSGTTAATGSGGGHTHSISSDGAHTHSVTTLPPFYSLCFIMKT
jgi:hypothetical protein